MKPELRADLVGAQPYGAPVAADVVRLNVNENPYSPPDDVIEEMSRAIAEQLSRANRYPDREVVALRQRIADYVGRGIAIDGVWAANGSNEIMHQLFSAYGGPGRGAVSFAPSYSMYPQYARDTFTDYVTIPREADFNLDMDASMAAISDHRPAVVLVPSPNNPTGHVLQRDQLMRLLDAASAQGSLLVVDEAYAEFMDPDQPTALDLLPDSENLVVTRTMSKAFGLAGLRVGYLVANPGIVADLQIVRMPYHLSSTTQAAAEVAMARATDLLRPIALIRSERDRLHRWADESGLRSTPSQGNFVFLGRFKHRHALWQQLLDMGVLVRESGPDGWLRVSVGRPDENDRFMATLSELLKRDGQESASVDRASDLDGTRQ
jgi:histidinol-phosphate aminotransferase